MGCCISKCKPKKYYIEDFTHVQVQDKLVLSSSQAPKTPIPVSKKISPLPRSPTISSASSVSSFTCSTVNTAASSCSSSASSVLSSKDRSFSNEFLWACVKENPHIVRINSIKEASRTLTVTKSPSQISNSPVKPVVALAKQASPAREKGSTPQKRGRSNSPSPLTRQKSFRKDPDYRLNPAYNYLPSRGLRSPSPSRRFNGDNYRGLLASTSREVCSSKRIVGPKVNALNSVSPSQRRENFRVSSPKLHSHDPTTPLKPRLRNRETFVHRISSKIDETALRAALSSQQENEAVAMEDVDNPLISLDCFIFL